MNINKKKVSIAWIEKPIGFDTEIRSAPKTLLYLKTNVIYIYMYNDYEKKQSFFESFILY